MGKIENLENCTVAFVKFLVTLHSFHAEHTTQEHPHLEDNNNLFLAHHIPYQNYIQVLCNYCTVCP